MKLAVALISLALAAGTAAAEEKKADAPKKEPTAAQKAQQGKDEGCNARPPTRKGRAQGLHETVPVRRRPAMTAAPRRPWTRTAKPLAGMPPKQLRQGRQADGAAINKQPTVQNAGHNCGPAFFDRIILPAVISGASSGVIPCATTLSACLPHSACSPLHHRRWPLSVFRKRKRNRMPRTRRKRWRRGVSAACRDSLKNKKVMVVVGQRRVSSTDANQGTYGSHPSTPSTSG